MSLEYVYLAILIIALGAFGLTVVSTPRTHKKDAAKSAEQPDLFRHAAE